jgi:hypothetical protein
MNRIALLLLVIVPFEAWAQQKAAFQGQRFVINLKFERRAIPGDYEQVKQTIANLKGKTPTQCYFQEKSRHCVQGSGWETFLPPFPIALPSEDSKLRFHDTERVWTPLKDVSHGEAHLTAWTKLVASGSIFSCDQLACFTIIRAISETGKERILAECSIANQALMGAPQDCKPLVITFGGNSWMAATVGSRDEMASMGRPDFTLTIRHKSPLSGSTILRAIETALTGAPLLLSATRVETTLIGTAEYRSSPILPGWRELVTVRVDVTSSRHFSDYTGVTISTTLYVNRQNTVQPADWHLPTPAQEQAYSRAILSDLKTPIQALCLSSEWVDDKTLRCETVVRGSAVHH